MTRIATPYGHQLSHTMSGTQTAMPIGPRLTGASGQRDRVSGGLPIKSLSFAVSALAILGWPAITPVAAQTRRAAHAVNPSLSLSAPATTPLQQQIQQNYATSLIAAQRQLLQHNPSGDGREELAIGQQLNGFTAPP
jgi:hypothetical protein